MSLNKEDILNHLKGLEIEVILLHGTAMVIHGIKETTRDIDCKVLDENSSFYIRNTKDLKPGEKFEDGFFDFGKIGVPLPPVRYTKIDGMLVQTVESIIEQKIAIGRAKDIEAIKLCIEKTGICIHNWLDADNETNKGIDHLEVYKRLRQTDMEGIPLNHSHFYKRLTVDDVVKNYDSKSLSDIVPTQIYFDNGTYKELPEPRIYDVMPMTVGDPKHDKPCGPTYNQIQQHLYLSPTLSSICDANDIILTGTESKLDNALMSTAFKLVAKGDCEYHKFLSNIAVDLEGVLHQFYGRYPSTTSVELFVKVCIVGFISTLFEDSEVDTNALLKSVAVDLIELGNESNNLKYIYTITLP